MIEIIRVINGILLDFLWGPVMIAAFLGMGLYFSHKTRWFQLRRWFHWMRHTLFSSLKKQKTEGETTSFQALCTSLAATLGTGNIAGVATAIVAGGPGTVFWMWVSAFLGMMTSFAEKSLGITYRIKEEDGQWQGGAMHYIEAAFHSKIPALFFAVFCLLASFGMGNMSQANSMADGLWSNFGIPPIITGCVAAGLVGIVVLGGAARISKITEFIVPWMSVIYIMGAVIAMIIYRRLIPDVLSLIFREAFSLRALSIGIARGVFSNEAGLGSSVIAHARAEVDHPAKQGMWGIFEVFADTIVMCSLTSFVILLTNAQTLTTANGTALTSFAFSEVFGVGGGMFVGISLAVFAFATMLGWCYFGQVCMSYLFGKKSECLYSTLYIGMIIIGSVASLTFVWEISDVFNGLLAIPNLLALFLLRKKVIALWQDYEKQG